ncbi:hypothetical protein [Oerskovia flava]|uniref:hypothetical protein n=1 Tax=Oerskovia flava TaxID=2986422 RepID=UPI00223EC025|nr:hypothetical protein [Oerskovia sp. JB1-3-2]
MRVAVRRRLSDADAHASGKLHTDHIGIVLEVTPAHLVLRPDAGGDHRDGPVPDVVILAQDVVAGRIVPPRPPRRIPPHPVR